MFGLDLGLGVSGCVGIVWRSFRVWRLGWGGGDAMTRLGKLLRVNQNQFENRVEDSKVFKKGNVREIKKQQK